MSNDQQLLRTPDAVSLVFDNKRVRVEGETLEGEVLLYFPKLVEDNVQEVHVKLRGSIVTYASLHSNEIWLMSQYRKITREHGNTSTRYTQRIDLVRENVSLWRKGSAYPPPDSHILKLPFRFVLPNSLPPSCQHSGFRWEGTIGYVLEVVGERPALHFNHRVLRSFPVLPVDSQGASIASALSAGWTGRWNTYEHKNEIRRGIWGDYSHVQATVSVVNISLRV
jgi:hypothetical protein